MKKLLFLFSVLFCMEGLANGYWYGESFIELTPVRDGLVYIIPNVEAQRDWSSTLLGGSFITKSAINSPKSYVANRRITNEGDTLVVLPEIKVKFKSSAQRLKADNILNSRRLVYDSVLYDDVHKYRCYVHNDDEVLDIISELSSLDAVEWCEPGMLISIKLCNPLYTQQYYLNNTGQYDGTAGVDINITPAWNITTGSSSIKVAVIDSGVDKLHEDLSANVLSGYTISDSTSGGSPSSYYAKYGHGTCCAGIIGAINNNVGIRGVASGVKLIPINMFKSSPTALVNSDSIANAIKWAYQRSDVLSCSWSCNPSQVIADAINEATSLGRGGKGCVVVAAAGNDGDAGYGVHFPANMSNVIAVGAINNKGVVWGYSCKGSELNLVAPSGDGNSTSDIVTTDISGGQGYVSGNYYYRFSGTSAACPQVAGVAALMLSINPYLPESRVREILQSQATDLGPAGFDTSYGYGLVNAGASVSRAQVEKPNFTIKKTYMSENEVICRATNLPSYYTAEWSILSGNMTTLTPNTPYPNQCTLTKTDPGMPTGMVMLRVKYGGTLICTTVASINVSTTATYNQVACSYYGVSHPATPPTVINSGQTVFVHQGCRVYLFNDAFRFYTVSHTGMIPDAWYQTCDQVQFELPLGSGGVPFVIQLKDANNVTQFIYTFFTYTGNALTVSPLSTSSYKIRLGDDDYARGDVSASKEWQIDIYNVVSAKSMLSTTVANDNEYILDTSSWPAGAYIIHVTVGEEVYTNKILVQ